MTQLAARARPRHDLELPRPIEVRAYQPADTDLLDAMSARLSRQSLYTRFFAGTPRLPSLYVRTLYKVDHWDREALLALVDDEIIGIAEYVRDPAIPARADLAVLVVDAWQRCGVGRLLAGALADLAGRRDITEFNADVLAVNTAALAAIYRLWPGSRPVQAAEGTATFLLTV